MLFSRLRDWLAGNEEAEAVLDQFEKRPSRYGGALEEILIEKARAEPARAKELEGLMDAMGPRIDVLQKIRVLAGQAVGFDVDKWERGVAKVEQDVGTVERDATLTGVRLRKDP